MSHGPNNQETSMMCLRGRVVEPILQTLNLQTENGIKHTEPIAQRLAESDLSAIN